MQSMFHESDDELMISRSRHGTGHNSHSPQSVVHVGSIARGAAAQILKQGMRCIRATMFQLPFVVVFLVAGSLLQVLFAFLYDLCLTTNLYYTAYIYYTSTII